MGSSFSGKLRSGVIHPPAAELVGFRMVSFADGESRFEMDSGRRHHNPMGTVHGGILCTLADSAMGMAFASTLDEGETFTTLEVKINFLRPVFEGKLFAKAKVVHRGRTVGLVDCDITTEDGKLVARAVSTCSVLRGEKAEGR
ncbi:MAG TPA: PaaI family thioesterase [Deltaproteobacteria bacterium]|nr:MAG: DUF4442 domain-containing protein [Deltaproteobacteria bacterium RBG_16_66_15]HBG72114.1 PaaI family thioesterase [Deltaproteobacteria bacterium]